MAEVTPAAEADADATVAAAAAPIATVEISTRKTRSSVAMSKNDMQKILPGINPLKALQTLPGVSFQTADPWGNNEQNLSLFIHGFSGQQLGYTMDGVPLGDQSYGNYNGLSPQRAVISENVGSVILSSGAGDLATASTSNLGGTIETFSSDPSQTRNLAVQQTVGRQAGLRHRRLARGLYAKGQQRVHARPCAPNHGSSPTASRPGPRCPLQACPAVQRRDLR